MTDTAITVRTLRQLDALVEEHIIKVFSKETLARNPELAPKYSTWLGLEPVIRSREDAGFWVSIEGACGLGMTPDVPDAAFHKMGGTQESGYATAPTIPIAVCLAALASVGVRAKLELGN
jgi:hypothetical protein